MQMRAGERERVRVCLPGDLWQRAGSCYARLAATNLLNERVFQLKYYVVNQFVSRYSPTKKEKMYIVIIIRSWTSSSSFAKLLANLLLQSWSRLKWFLPSPRRCTGHRHRRHHHQQQQRDRRNQVLGSPILPNSALCMFTIEFTPKCW